MVEEVIEAFDPRHWPITRHRLDVPRIRLDIFGRNFAGQTPDKVINNIRAELVNEYGLRASGGLEAGEPANKAVREGQFFTPESSPNLRHMQVDIHSRPETIVRNVIHRLGSQRLVLEGVYHLRRRCAPGTLMVRRKVSALTQGKRSVVVCHQGTGDVYEVQQCFRRDVATLRRGAADTSRRKPANTRTRRHLFRQAQSPCPLRAEVRPARARAITDPFDLGLV